MRPPRSSGLLLPVAVAAIGCFETTGPVLGPPSGLPVPDLVTPAPSSAQVDWQRQELAAFLHFGMNTFTGKEMGDGTESPTLFAPTAFDARQWITALKSAGFREAMLTAKHHDGFCLWPTTCTDHSVARSPFQAGKGDVVREFVDAAHEGNVRVGLALSPLDRHDPSYGTPKYVPDVFECQLGELLKNYGPVDEIWLWQAPGVPTFDRVAIRDFIHARQPNTLVELANAAPSSANELRSIGLAGPANQPTPADQSNIVPPTGGAGTPLYIPAEGVYTIRTGWFWHAAEDSQVKTVDQLLELYFETVGRNSLLRLNVPPDTRGLLADPDVAVLKQLRPAIEALYRTNVAAGRQATADSTFEGRPEYAASAAVDGNLETFWAAAADQTTARLVVDLEGPRSFDLISLQEPIELGERASELHVEAQVNGAWTTIATGTTIGERKLFRVGSVTADHVALVITSARGAPAIAELGLYDSAAAMARATTSQ